MTDEAPEGYPGIAHDLETAKRQLRAAQHFFESPGSFSQEEFQAIGREVFGVQTYTGRLPGVPERVNSVRIISSKPSKNVERKATCGHCGVRLAFVPADAEEFVHRDYGGGSDSYLRVRCPNCGSNVDVLK